MGDVRPAARAGGAAEFETLMRGTEPPLRRALVAAYGFEEGREATAEGWPVRGSTGSTPRVDRGDQGTDRSVGRAPAAGAPCADAGMAGGGCPSRGQGSPRSPLSPVRPAGRRPAQGR